MLHMLCKPAAAEPVAHRRYSGDSQLICIDAMFPDRQMLNAQITTERSAECCSPAPLAPSPTPVAREQM